MGFFQDYMEGVAMRKNPQLLQQKIAGIEASKMAEMAEQIYGSRGTPANYQQQFDEVSGPMQPGQTRGYQRVNVLNPGENERTEAIQGTGMFDESISPDQRHILMNKRMLGSGVKGFNDQWAKNQGNMQAQNMTGMNSMARQIQQQQYDTANPSQSAMMKNVQAGGFTPGTPAYQAEINKQRRKPGMTVTTGKTIQPLNTTDLAKWQVPSGDGGWQDATPGMSMADIGQAGGKLKPKMAVGDVGKYMMLKGAQKEFNTIEGIWNDEGELDQQLLFELTAQDWDPTGIFGAKISSAKGQEIFGALERGMQGITRTETGAAMPAEEVQNTKKRFMPKLGDKPEAVSSKLRAYKYFINNAVDLMNPQGLTRSQMTPAQATTAMKNAVDKSFESTNESSQPLNPKIGDKWTDPKTGKTYTYRG